MSRKAVVDASVILAFYLPAEPFKENALAFLADITLHDAQILIPPLTRFEVLNALFRCVQGLRPGPLLTLSEAFEIIEAFQGLPLREISPSSKRILELAVEHHVSAYDASYLALAESEGTEFFTGDKRLYRAVRGKLPWVRFIGEFPGPT